MRTPPSLTNIFAVIGVLSFLFLLVWIQIAFPDGEKWVEAGLLFLIGGVGGLTVLTLFLGELFRLFYQPADKVLKLVPDASGKGLHLFTSTDNPSWKYSVKTTENINYSYVTNTGKIYSHNLQTKDVFTPMSLKDFFQTPQWNDLQEKFLVKRNLALNPITHVDRPYHVSIKDSFPKDLDPNTIYVVTSGSNTYIKPPKVQKFTKFFGAWEEYTSDKYYLNEKQMIFILRRDFFGPLDFLYIMAIDLENGKKLWGKMI